MKVIYRGFTDGLNRAKEIKSRSQSPQKISANYTVMP
jgi:hypothetical protein